IGRKPIPVPKGVEIDVDGQHVVVKGPKGQLEHTLPPAITLTREGDELNVVRPSDAREHRALHGLSRTLVANMVTGVSEGFEKRLEIVGVGYRATAQGPDKIELALGFSHPVPVTAPAGITFEVPGPTAITVRGIDK